MKKSLLFLLCAFVLKTAIRGQFYSDTLFYANTCPTGVACTGGCADPMFAVDSNLMNFATLYNGLGVGSSVSIEYGFSVPAQGGALIGITLQEGNQFLSVGLLSNITVELFSSTGTLVGQKTGLDLQDLGLLSSNGSVPTYVVSFFTAPGNYNIQRVRVTLGGVANVLNDIRVYNAFYLDPAQNTSGNICGLEYAVNHVSSSCSGLLCSVQNPQLAVDLLNYDDYATLNIPVGLIGVLGTAQIELSWNTPGDSGDFVGFIIGQQNLVLSVTLLDAMDVELLDSSGNVVYTQLGFQSVGLTLLSGSSDKSIIGFYSPVKFVSARLRLTQLVGLLTSLRVYGAVKFNPTPQVVGISSSATGNLCQGDTVTLTATAGYAQYFWSTGDTTQSISVTQSGNYTLTAVDSSACTFYSTVAPVSFNPLPAAPALAAISTNPLTICQGDTATLTVNSSSLPFTWSTGDTTQSIPVTTAGFYYASVTDTLGCSSHSDTVQVNIETADISLLSAANDNCAGTPVTITVLANGTVTWNDGSMGTSYMVSPMTTTTYTAFVITTHGCNDMLQVTINVADSTPVAQAMDDNSTIEENDMSVAMDVGNNDVLHGTSTWTILAGPQHGSAGIQNGEVTYTPSPNYFGNDSIQYEVCTDNICGTVCDTAWLRILIREDPDGSNNPLIRIPGGVSHNGDGVNDLLVIEGIEYYPNNRLTILNRWGEVVYKSAPYANNWDGSANTGLVAGNDKLPDGTYYYVLILGDDSKPMRGFIELRK